MVHLTNVKEPRGFQTTLNHYILSLVCVYLLCSLICDVYIYLVEHCPPLPHQSHQHDPSMVTTDSCLHKKDVVREAVARMSY